ncbi:hypothetical protein [Streptomyces sp. NPDC057552]|uniref:hypothetical protein n=1 Tax=Streptomyces sp. NPDC057552 TaxID=3350537 RepID=UPI00367B3D21
MDTDTLIYQARQALGGRNPEHGWPINNGPERASAHALVALAGQQQETNRHLASIAESLAALVAETAQAPAGPEPKRRLWLPTRRKTA